MADNIFSLLDEPWVQVVYRDGHPGEISLRQIFSDAPDIKELSGDIPQQKLPLIPTVPCDSVSRIPCRRRQRGADARAVERNLFFETLRYGYRESVS